MWQSNKIDWCGDRSCYSGVIGAANITFVCEPGWTSIKLRFCSPYRDLKDQWCWFKPEKSRQNKKAGQHLSTFIYNIWAQRKNSGVFMAESKSFICQEIKRRKDEGKTEQDTFKMDKRMDGWKEGGMDGWKPD